MSKICSPIPEGRFEGSKFANVQLSSFRKVVIVLCL
jgi:hypothetical protein